MRKPKGVEIEPTRERLTEWLQGRLPDARELRIEELVAPEGAGFSNQTLLMDARWREGSTEKRGSWVARLQPTGRQVFPDYDLELQYRVMDLLGKTDVPVPRMFAFEHDADVLGVPFYVMEKVAGEIPPDNPPFHTAGWVCDLDPAQRESLWWNGVDIMARIHCLDWRQEGFSFLDGDSNHETPLQQHLRYYDDYLNWVMEERTHPSCEPTLEWLKSNVPKEVEPVRLVWGDSRLSNMIFKDGRCVAVLDWEMVRTGNPVQDLAWFMTIDRCLTEGIGAERLPGFPPREATVERWEQTTGLEAAHLGYYEVFAAFRFGVIMASIGRLMREDGILPDESTFDVDNLATTTMLKLLEEQG